MTSATIPAKFHADARRDAAAFYLSQLARAILAGEMSVAAGEERVALATPEIVRLEIEFKQARRTNSVAIRLRWPSGTGSLSAPTPRPLRDPA